MASRDCFWDACSLLELFEGMLEGQREFGEMHSLTDPAAFAKVVHLLYPDPHFNYFAASGKDGGFVLCLHPDVKCVALARHNAALMKHLWFGHQKDSVSYLTAAMVGKLLDQDEDQDVDEGEDVDCDVLVQRVKRDIGLLAHQWDIAEVIQKYDSLNRKWITVKNKRKRDDSRTWRAEQWQDVSQLVRCAIPMSMDARLRPSDTCLEIASKTGAHEPYEIDLQRMLLWPTGQA